MSDINSLQDDLRRTQNELNGVRDAARAASELAYDQIDELTEKYNELRRLVTDQASLIDNILNSEIPRLDGRIAGVVATQVARLQTYR